LILKILTFIFKITIKSQFFSQNIHCFLSWTNKNNMVSIRRALVQICMPLLKFQVFKHKYLFF
jgi:uncharacterized protein YggT (Ycf19 family)